MRRIHLSDLMLTRSPLSISDFGPCVGPAKDAQNTMPRASGDGWLGGRRRWHPAQFATATSQRPSVGIRWRSSQPTESQPTTHRKPFGLSPARNPSKTVRAERSAEGAKSKPRSSSPLRLRRCAATLRANGGGRELGAGTDAFKASVPAKCVLVAQLFAPDPTRPRLATRRKLAGLSPDPRPTENRSG
jgi:hypothetical protein